MATKLRFLSLILGTAFIGVALQGCVLAAGTAAGAAGGYEAHKHGYDVQSPVKKDSAGGYKGQSPVKHSKKQDSSASEHQDNQNHNGD